MEARDFLQKLDGGEMTEARFRLEVKPSNPLDKIPDSCLLHSARDESAFDDVYDITIFNSVIKLCKRHRRELRDMLSNSLK